MWRDTKEEYSLRGRKQPVPVVGWTSVVLCGYLEDRAGDGLRLMSDQCAIQWLEPIVRGLLVEFVQGLKSRCAQP